MCIHEHAYCYNNIFTLVLKQLYTCMALFHQRIITPLQSTLAKDYVCFKPMEGYRDMPIDEMVQIEDKDDLSTLYLKKKTNR